MSSTHALAARITAFLGPAFDGMWQRFCPGDQLPATVVGQTLFGGTRSALLHLLP